MFNNHNPRSSKTQKPQIYQGSQYGSRFLGLGNLGCDPGHPYPGKL